MSHIICDILYVTYIRSHDVSSCRDVTLRYLVIHIPKVGVLLYVLKLNEDQWSFLLMADVKLLHHHLLLNVHFGPYNHKIFL